MAGSDEWTMEFSAVPAPVPAAQPGLQVVSPSGPGAGSRSARGLEPADARRLLRRATRALVAAARADEVVTLSSLLLRHLGPDAPELAVIEETWPAYDHVNVQTALDRWLDRPGTEHETIGVVGFQHRPFGLADLLHEGGGYDPYGPRPGNVARVNVPAGPDGEVLACVVCALFLVTEGPRRAALLLRGPDPSMGRSLVTVEVVGTDPAWTPELTRRLRALAVEHNVFRGQVLSFGGEVFGDGETLLRFHRRPALAPDGLVLPPETLAAVHRQVVEVGVLPQGAAAARGGAQRGGGRRPDQAAVGVGGPPRAGARRAPGHPERDDPGAARQRRSRRLASSPAPPGAQCTLVRRKSTVRLHASSAEPAS